MLNERAEFEAYITNPESSSGQEFSLNYLLEISVRTAVYMELNRFWLYLQEDIFLTLTVKMKFIQMGLFALNF